MAEAKVRSCGQCGKPAICHVNGVALCVDHYYKMEVAKTLALRLAAIGMNHAAAEMDFATGLRNFTPRMQVPEIPTPPPIFNHIDIKDSVVGSVNTGTVHAIDVSVTYLENSGNTQIGEALKQLTQTIANDESLPTPQKNELLDQVAYLSEQAATAAKDRKPGMIRAALIGLGAGIKGATTVASSVSELSSAWNSAEPLLKSLFGIQ